MKTSRRAEIQLIGGVTATALCRKGFARQPQNAGVDKDRIHLQLRPLRPDEVVFFNSDRSALGAHASLVYGMQASGGLTMLDVRRKRGRPQMCGTVSSLPSGTERLARLR